MERKPPKRYRGEESFQAEMREKSALEEEKLAKERERAAKKQAATKRRLAALRAKPKPRLKLSWTPLTCTQLHPQVAGVRIRLQSAEWRGNEVRIHYVLRWDRHLTVPLLQGLQQASLDPQRSKFR